MLRVLFIPLTVLMLLLQGGLTANADAVVYSNLATFSGFSFLLGGAAAGPSPMTRVMMDDIDPINVPAAEVRSISFSLGNFNATAVSFRPNLRFWNADGVGGGPGTYLGTAGFTLAPITIGAGTLATFTENFAPGNGFIVPNTKFWAGLTFDNNSNTPGLASVAELNLLAAGLYNPPTIGSTTNQFFLTSTPGSFYLTNNPAGTLFNSGRNIGFEFSTAVPEPNLTALLGLTVLGMCRYRSNRVRRQVKRSI
jgi:hypothetical protein